MCVLSVFHSGEAIVHTEAQAGPLYRVVGSPLSISCNVSGFSNPDAEQEFEVRVKKPANPTFEINIISTGNNDFGYAIYLDRVRSKEITLTHVSPTAVVFEIQRLQKNDEGEFECSVKNSENVYLGTYSAHTVVKGNPSALRHFNMTASLYGMTVKTCDFLVFVSVCHVAPQ